MLYMSPNSSSDTILCSSSRNNIPPKKEDLYCTYKCHDCSISLAIPTARLSSKCFYYLKNKTKGWVGKIKTIWISDRPKLPETI